MFFLFQWFYFFQVLPFLTRAAVQLQVLAQQQHQQRQQTNPDSYQELTTADSSPTKKKIKPRKAQWYEWWQLNFFLKGVVCLFFNLCRSEAGTKKCKRTSICERAMLCRLQSMKCVQSPLFTCLNAFYWMICCESRHRSYSSYLFHYPLSLICKSECVTVCVTAAELTSISWYALGKTDSTSEHWICCHITAGWKVICKSLNAVVLEKRKRNLKRKKFIYKKKVCCQQVFMSVAGMNSKKEICLWSVPRWK